VAEDTAGEGVPTGHCRTATAGPRSVVTNPAIENYRAAGRPGDRFPLGADLVKDPGVPVAAYDDGSGVTAIFTRSALNVLNRPRSAPHALG
jgi:hypothetical protein